MLKILIYIINFSLLFFAKNYSFADVISDSLAVNSEFANQSDTLTAHKKDSIRFYEPLSFHGTISNQKLKPFFKITKDSILLTDYTTLSDIFAEKLSIYPLFLGSYANYNSFLLFGGFPSGLALRFNGRMIGNHQFHFSNFETYPTEYFENIEIFTGSDAVIFSENSSTALINFQEKKYNTKNPYTKIWFSQAAYDFLASDGIFSQNFMPNFNFTFGFRRMAVKGRFDNSWMDSWSLRGGLRWNINERTNISLVDIFTNQGQGTNGGIDRENSQNIYDNLAAYARYDQLDERVFKHDLTLTLTSIFDAYYDSLSILNEQVENISPAFSDKKLVPTSIFNATLFFSHSEWNQKRQSELFYIQNDSVLFLKNISIYTGASTSIDFNINSWLKIKAGSEIAYLTFDKTHYFSSVDNFRWSVFGHFHSLPFSKNVKISGGLRTGFIQNYNYLNAGAKFEYDFEKHTNIYIDLSKYDRIPSASEGFHLTKETGVLFLAGLKWISKQFDIITNIFYRDLESPIISKSLLNNTFIQDIRFINEKSLTSYGMTVSLNFSPFKNFHTKTNLIVQKFLLNNQNLDILPLFYPVFDSYYELTKGRSYVRLGFNASLIPENRGLSFNPLRRSYIFYNNLPAGEQENSTLFFNGINFYASARLGTVYVKISLQNAISTNYYFVKYYPMFDRNLRISLLWAFDD